MPPAPRKRGPAPGSHPRKDVEHVCPYCGVHFTATAKAIYDRDACRQAARKRRIRDAATA